MKLKALSGDSPFAYGAAKIAGILEFYQKYSGK
jgi:hypothetical protein